MLKIKIGLLAITLAAWATPSSSTEQTLWVNGQNIASSHMRVFGMSLPPIGHVRFCQRHPAECSATNAISRRIKLTSKRQGELEAVNEFVNRIINPVTDQQLYGRVEHWTYPNSDGDCEDYVLLKRKMLINKGWPESALLITVVLDENREGHAILTVRTADGDYLLDNKHSKIMSWNQSPYRFIKRQSYRDPRLWMSLVPDENARNRETSLTDLPEPAKVSAHMRHTNVR